jgi:hypothetical protein
MNSKMGKDEQHGYLNPSYNVMKQHSNLGIHFDNIFFIISD